MNDKIVLITGATAGFGKATATLLAQNGYTLILIARRIDLLKKLQHDLGMNHYIAQVDITKKDEIQKFFSDLPDTYRHISIVINNAGLALGTHTVQDGDIEDWEVMINTNIKGMLYITKSALPYIMKEPSSLIINIGSVAGNVPYKGGNVYGATKAFVKQFSKNLRADLAGTNVKITNIEPGMAETEFSLVRFKGSTDAAKNVYKETRPLKAEDIANTIFWVIKQPEHVNIDSIEIMPVDQTPAGFAVTRRTE